MQDELLKSKDRNNCLNLLKCVACVGVVFIHVAFPGFWGGIIKGLFYFAVPLFYMISGYYAYGCTYERIKKRLMKIVKKMLFAIIFLLFFEILLHAYNSTLVMWLDDFLSWKTFVKMIVFCTIDWAIPLWYLIAMAETYLVWLYVVKKKAEERITRYTWLFVAMGAALVVLVDSLGLDWSLKTNFISRALPWFMLGYLVNKRIEHAVYRVSNISILSLTAIGLAISLSAIVLKTSVDYSYIGVLLSAPSLFLIGIKNPDFKVGRFVGYMSDKLSFFVYILHPLVSEVLIMIAYLIGFRLSGFYWLVHPILTLVASVLIAMAFARFFRNERMRRVIY